MEYVFIEDESPLVEQFYYNVYIHEIDDSNERADLKVIKKFLRKKMVKAYVATDKGEVVGGVIYTILKDPMFAYISYLCVEKSFKGERIELELVKLLKKESNRHYLLTEATGVQSKRKLFKELALGELDLNYQQAELETGGAVSDRVNMYVSDLYEIKSEKLLYLLVDIYKNVYGINMPKFNKSFIKVEKELKEKEVITVNRIY